MYNVYFIYIDIFDTMIILYTCVKCKALYTIIENEWKQLLIYLENCGGNFTTQLSQW